ncbi:MULTISPECIES: hypothetical protein [Nocardia]|uniref:hypothetical protein n=1 Tax=Nocardia TaxID=1817 RepID=UPI0024567D51|nr:MULTISPECIES: hypothetical protein [Nocardia]
MTITSTEELRGWLDAGAALAGNDFDAAAIGLLDFAGLLDRRDVRAHVQIETVPDRDGRDVRAAWIDWPALADVQKIGTLGGTQHRLLRLALSIAHRTSIDLRGALSDLGHAHARAVLAAVVRALGLAGDVDFTDSPAYLARRRADQEAVQALLADRGLDADGEPTTDARS